MFKKRDKRGLSPVIATVLLIAMVLVIALIIFLWFRGLTKEAVTKFGGTNVELICQDVSFLPNYDEVSGVLSVINSGNVPIYSLNIKISKVGGFETFNIKDISQNWPRGGLLQGRSFSSEDLRSTFSGATSISLIPVLLGESGGAEKTHVCDEQYSKEISIT
jgi:flagellin-like protein